MNYSVTSIWRPMVAFCSDKRVMKIAPNLLAMSFLVMGCASQHDGLNATLWVQTSAEYQGNSEMLFNVAESQLPLLRDKANVTADIDQAKTYGCEVGVACPALATASLAPAVIMDVDETVLDNSAYQARLIKKGEQWNPSSWDKWVEEKTAFAVPGALAFVERAKAEGVTVIFVTNRKCSVREDSNVSSFEDLCPQKLDTADNLVEVGYPLLSSSDLLALRGERVEWGNSEKRERRKHFSQRYRIIMLIGDDLGDLASNIKSASVAERREFVKTHQSLFGKYWFQLTNPVYGSWQRSINYEDKLDYLRYK